jgi:hypothetical protein
VLRGPAIADGAARASKRLREQIVGDVDATPDGADQLVAADGAFGVFDQISQQVERLRRNRQHLAGAAQFAHRGIEFKIIERSDRFGHEHIGRQPPGSA